MRRIFQHTLLWIIAVSVLNTSIDVTDNSSLSPQTSGGDQYIEIESIVELLMDSALDKTLPDQQGNDYQTTLKKTTVIDFSLPEKRVRTIGNLLLLGKKHLPYAYCSGALSPGFVSHFSPPPDTI
jgi:hypothetical protein